MTFGELPIGSVFKGRYLGRDLVGSEYRKLGEGDGWNAESILSGALAQFRAEQEVEHARVLDSTED